MSLEEGKLRKLVDAGDLDGIRAWVDEVVTFARDEERRTLLHVREKPGLRQVIERALNAHSAENGSDTPDFVLAEYLLDCLTAFDKALRRRAQWYGRRDVPGGVVVVDPERGEDVETRQLELRIDTVQPRARR